MLFVVLIASAAGAVRFPRSVAGRQESWWYSQVDHASTPPKAHDWLKERAGLKGDYGAAFYMRETVRPPPPAWAPESDESKNSGPSQAAQSVQFAYASDAEYGYCRNPLTRMRDCTCTALLAQCGGALRGP